MKRIPILFSLLGVCICMTAQQTWTLRDCIEYAIDHNLEIQKKEIAQKQQEVELNTAKFSRLPDLSGSASQSFNFGRGLNEKNTYIDRNTQNTNFDLSTNVPLFTGLQIPNTIAYNKLNLKAAIEDLNKAKEDIGINVTAAFLKVLFNKELYNVALEKANLSKEQYERAKALNEVGKAAVSDVYEAKARAAQDELSVTEAFNDKELSLLDLSQLLELTSPEGFDITAPEGMPDLSIVENPVDIYHLAVTTRPSILAAQYRWESAGKNINIAQSGYYPKLSFSAGLGSSYYRISGLDKTPINDESGDRAGNESFGRQLKNNFSKAIGLNLSIPIFNRLETRNRVKYARLQQAEYLTFLDESKKTLYKEIQQAYYNAVAAQSKFNSSNVAVEANEAAFEVIREKFENGKATSLEYNESKMNLMKSISDNLQAKYDFIFSMKILDFYKGIPLTL